MSDANTNVVMFPFARMVQREDGSIAPPQTIEEVHNRIIGLRQYHIQECLEPIVEMLMQQLVITGFDVSDDAYAKDVTVLVEALRSLMMKNSKVWHPFQELAEGLFTREQEDEPFDLAEEINLKFTQAVVGSKIEDITQDTEEETTEQQQAEA